MVTQRRKDAKRLVCHLSFLRELIFLYKDARRVALPTLRLCVFARDYFVYTPNFALPTLRLCVFARDYFGFHLKFHLTHFATLRLCERLFCFYLKFRLTDFASLRLCEILFCFYPKFPLTHFTSLRAITPPRTLSTESVASSALRCCARLPGPVRGPLRSRSLCP